MTAAALTAGVIFAFTYLVIGLQRLPALHLGRPAGALLGAIAMVAFGVLDFDGALAAIDLDTILFLLGMMIVLAYLELSGFFELLERQIMGFARSPRGLLILVILSSGFLAAVFMNDTVCLLLTPVIVRVTGRMALPPVPYLIGLVTAANIGSCATILGNPQNAFIAVRSGLSLIPFTAALWPVALGGLALDALILGAIYRRSVGWDPINIPPPREPAMVHRWMLGTSLAAGAGMVVALGFGARPAAAAMTAAGFVILAGAARPRRALQEVDWGLLLFFSGLFVVMRGFESAGFAHAFVATVAGPLDPATPLALARLGAAATLLSQAVSNVPAVMLFAPSVASAAPDAAATLWPALAAFATLAGNLTIIGSVANVIVAESARRLGVEMRFGEYLRSGVPITLATLGLAWVWLSLR